MSLDAVAVGVYDDAACVAVGWAAPEEPEEPGEPEEPDEPEDSGDDEADCDEV